MLMLLSFRPVRSSGSFFFLLPARRSRRCRRDCLCDRAVRHAIAATNKQRRRPAQAGHDARRPLQHERVHRRVPRRGVREGLPQRVLPHHLQPGRRRGAENELDAVMASS